jgi:hypothetical protein
MSAANETEPTKSDDKLDEAKAPNEAIARFAQYTAPVMLALLASAGHGTPVAAATNT